MAVSKKGIITAADFNAITATYDVFWKDPKDGSGNVITYTYDSNHSTDLVRRKGWGQTTSLTDVAVTSLIEADNVNDLVAQINSGLYHCDNDLPLLVKYATIDSVYADSSNTVPATPSGLNSKGWLGIQSEVANTINTNKHKLGALSGEDSYSDTNYFVDVSNGGTGWQNSLTCEVSWTFASYTEARHYFNSGGSIVVDLTAGIGAWSNSKGNASAVENINRPGTNPGVGGGTNGSDDWLEIFRSIGEIHFKAESCDRTGSNGIGGDGFYGLDHAGGETSMFTASGFGPYAYAYSYAYATPLKGAGNETAQYGDRAVEVLYKGVETGGNFVITAKVKLTDDPDDTQLMDTVIVASCYNLQPINTPDHAAIGSNASFFTVGSTQYRFDEKVQPTVAQVSAWT
jgi:hypothetical protein